jgi:hypothetical protein
MPKTQKLRVNFLNDILNPDGSWLVVAQFPVRSYRYPVQTFSFRRLEGHPKT